jgi:hypothetical protein
MRPWPTLSGAPLAQRQSNGLLIRRFRVRIPRGALGHFSKRPRRGRGRPKALAESRCLGSEECGADNPVVDDYQVEAFGSKVSRES